MSPKSSDIELSIPTLLMCIIYDLADFAMDSIQNFGDSVPVFSSIFNMLGGFTDIALIFVSVITFYFLKTSPLIYVPAMVDPVINEGLFPSLTLSYLFIVFTDLDVKQVLSRGA